MEIQRQSEAFAYRLAAPPVSRHYSTKVLQGVHKTAADLVKDYTDNLYKEFHDWIDEQGAWPVGGHGPADYTKPMGGPLTYWDNIEGFFKERYPEAYRGFNMAEEKARPLMDTGYCGWSDQTRRAKPYETGPEAEAKYGYDPRQLAAGMMYLHTWSHSQNPQTGWRGDKLSRDIDRLSDIFQKRMQMQENARQRKLVNANTIRCAADDDLILYHGTGADSVPHIQQNGLMHPPGVSPAGWPMLTTDFDQAKAYATRDNPVVLEYHVPANLTYGRWRTHRTGEEPYLWDAEPHTAYDYPAQSYALKRPLPATFLRAIHPVNRKLASPNTIRCDGGSVRDSYKTNPLMSPNPIP